MKDRYIKTTELKWEEIQKDVFERECIANKDGVSISILKLEPNREIPLHKHRDTRHNFILKGSMSDKDRIYNKGDLITNEKDSEHRLEAGYNGCEFLLIWN